eukprot:8986884-Alexandrium_andersonii.AAC.1
MTEPALMLLPAWASALINGEAPMLGSWPFLSEDATPRSFSRLPDASKPSGLARSRGLDAK